MPQRCSTPSAHYTASSSDIGLGLARHTRLGVCLVPKELHLQNQSDEEHWDDGDDSEEEIILKITRLPYGARNMGLTDEEDEDEEWEWQCQGPSLGKCERIYPGEYSEGYQDEEDGSEEDTDFWNAEPPSFRTDIFDNVKTNVIESKSNTSLISSPISPKTIPKHAYLDSEDLICLIPVEENDNSIDMDIDTMPGLQRKRKYEHFSAETATGKETQTQTQTQENAGQPCFYPKYPPNPYSCSRNYYYYPYPYRDNGMIQDEEGYEADNEDSYFDDDSDSDPDYDDYDDDDNDPIPEEYRCCCC